MFKKKLMLFIYALFPVTKIVTLVKINFVNNDNIPKLMKKLLTVDQLIDRKSKIHL
jgi:hypothetical protein